MPEVYNPQRTRGNAGKSGLRRIQKEKKPYWPGLDMDGHLIKMPSTDTDNTTNNNKSKDKDKMVLDTHQSPSKISNKLVEDDPILSFDNDPPFLQRKVTRIHNNDTTAVSRPSSQKDDSPSHRTSQQQQQQQQETVVDSKKMSPLQHKSRRKRTMDDFFFEETSTSSSSSSSCSSSSCSNPEHYNKIAEIVATRGTRSGRQFHSSQQHQPEQQHQPMKRTKRQQQQQQQLHTSGGVGMSLLQMAVPGIPDSMEECIQKKDSSASKRDPTKQMDELDFDDDEREHELDQQHQPQQTENSKFRNQIVQEFIPSLQNIPPTGHRRRRKRKQSPSLDQSDITPNSIMDGEKGSMGESSSSFNATKFSKPSQNDKVDPTNDTNVTGNVVQTNRTVNDSKNNSNMDGTVPVSSASGLTPSTDARQFAELAQSIIRNQLPIIGRAMEEIWSSLLKVVPEKSDDSTDSSSMTAVLETLTTTPHDTMNQERGDNELLVRMRTLCDKQDASVRRLEELRSMLVEDSLRERDDWKKNHDQTVARLSSQLEASQENATLLKQQNAKTNGENQRLRQQLQATSDLVESLQTSRDEAHRRMEEHALELKAKEDIISSQTAELKRLRDEIAILKSERNNQQQHVHESTTEEKVSHDGSDATIVVAALEEERPVKGIISGPLLQPKSKDDDRSEQRCNPAVLLRKAGKPSSFRKNNNPVHRIQTGGTNHLGTSLRTSSSSSRTTDGLGTRLRASKISTLKVPVARHPPRFFVRIKTEVVQPSSDHYLSENRVDKLTVKPNNTSYGPISIESPR
ncbi:hypothetical protein IV203_016037 [Nitzschia inconspicua]|uniref:Uncharacterized protein n=1 Tax=Nitzschia inconspicua TaxID=303405 RepID=A0A9K3KPK2_9STRA|nr:hypothetical protein IV203_016037 [Nitzschia inconspicua]